MGVPISAPKKNQGSIGSDLLKMVMSYYTGGLSQTADKQREAKQGEDTPMVGAPSKGQKPGVSVVQPSAQPYAPPPVDTAKAPAMAEPNPQPNSPIDRRISAQQGDPLHQINEGLAALKDPSIPDELRQQYAQPLLQAKHYGKWT